MRVKGRVQGVFFRHSAREKARELNITGFARNEEDGAVYIEIDAHECLMQDTSPSSARECEYCAYRVAAHEMLDK